MTGILFLVQFNSVYRNNSEKDGTLFIHAHKNEIIILSSITIPQDAHKRSVLQIVEWLTDLLSGLARHELTIIIQASKIN